MYFHEHEHHTFAEGHVSSVRSVIKDLNWKGLLRQQREELHNSQSHMVMSPAGIGTMNDCAGENQQQFARPYPTRRKQQFT
jgi:hypothetical protein